MPPGLDPAAILLVFAFLLFPGLGIAFAVLPAEGVSLPVRMALALAFGYSAIALVSLALALTHALYPGSFLAAGGVVAVTAWTLAARRAREHLRAIREDLAAGWKRYVTFGAVLVGTVLVRLTHEPISNFVPTTLRYWADGVEIADNHGIPRTTLQWGMLLKPTISKVGLNTFNATMSFFIGRGALAATGTLLFVVSIALVFIAYGLADQMGLLWFAPLVPVLLFVNGRVWDTELTSDLNQNLAENWGRLAMLAALILTVRALTPRGHPGGEPNPTRLNHGALRDGILAGIMFGVAAGSHLVPTVAGIGFAGAYAVTRMVVDRGVVRVMKISGVALCVAAVVGGLVLVLPKGDLGFGGAEGSHAYAQLVSDLNLCPTFDATLYLVNGDFQAACATYPYSPESVLSDYAFQVTRQKAADEARQRPSLPKAVLPSCIALLCVLLLWKFGGDALRTMAGAAVLFELVLILVGVGFAAHYHVYALETFGNRRLFNYVPISFVLIAAGIAELCIRWLGAHLRSPERGRWVQPLVAGLITLAVAATVMPSARMLEGRSGPGVTAGLDLVNWVGQRDPCQGYILTDRRTLATFETLEGRAAILEGMGPHVRPDVLEIAIKSMIEAGAFFMHPAEGLDYLRSKGVAYVVTTNMYVIVHSLGGWRLVGPSDALTFAKAPFLVPVFSNNAGTVYQVKGFEPNSAMPNPADQPGFCKS